ncbi:MAG: NERD domain-containing protein [Burkholderiaceae bacterium]|nr:NERD domain-containing protein [Burkholderiaceae bacterium]
MPPIAHLLIAFAAGVVVGVGLVLAQRRAREYQNWGEQLVAGALGDRFSAPDFHLLNHVTLPLKDGSTQVDHILVSRFGVFVIETKDYKGWIFANAKQATWTQVLYRSKFRFRNPIFQNLGHVRAVQDLLDFLPSGAVRSAVVFTGEAKFKTDVPEGVFDLPGLVRYIRESEVEVMSVNRVQFCVGRLETARLAITAQTDVEHIQSLERRHGAA